MNKILCSISAEKSHRLTNINLILSIWNNPRNNLRVEVYKPV